MAGVIDTAWVDVRPRLAQFETELRTGLNRGFTNLEGTVQRTTTNVERRFQRTATEVGGSFRQVGTQSGRAFDEVGARASRSGLAVVESFKRTASGSERALRGIDAGAVAQGIGGDFQRAATRADASMRQVAAESNTQFARVERNARQATVQTGQHFDDLKRRVAGGLVALGGIALLRDSIAKATDLGESINAVHVELGTAADGWIAFGRDAVSNLGLTQASLNTMAIPLTAMLKNAGFAGAGLEQTLERLARRATDVGSVFNATTTDVLGAFTAAIRGEFDPIERFGVSLNMTKVNAIAAGRGISQATLQTDQHVKSQIILDEILKQTAATQGDFARTSMTGANAQRILAARVADLETKIAAGLLPTVDKLVGGLGSMAEFLARNERVVTPLVITVGGLITAVVAANVAMRVWRGTTEALTFWHGKLVTILPTTTVETEGLAVAETHAAVAGTAAATSASALVLRLGLLAGAIVGVVLVGRQLESTEGRQAEALNRHGTLLDLVNDDLRRHITSQGDLRVTTDVLSRSTNTAADAAARQGLAAEQQAAAARRAEAQQARVTARTNELSAALQQSRAEYAQQRDAVAETIRSYDGLITKSGVTARDVIRDLHNQVVNFTTYSADVRRLIRAGVDPTAIRELSQKGPQYVHALATGTNRELGQYKKFWGDRQREVRRDFNSSMEGQLADLKKKMDRMQAELNSLRPPKPIAVTVTGMVIWSKEAALLKQLTGNFSHKLPAFQRGGLLPGYGGGDRRLILAEDGEAVVPKDKVKQPEFRTWAATQGIPGFQLGGLVRNVPPLEAAVGRALELAERSALTSASRMRAAVIFRGGGSAGIKGFIHSVDPLPYSWGAAGPGAYDCSGLVGAVYGKMRGDPGAGHGRRYFTTSSIGIGVPGLKSGLGGVLNIGVTPGMGHMVGNYGGLGFEARSTATGIFTGAAARSPSSFARHYHMARGGLVGPLAPVVDPRVARWLSRLPGVDVGGDPGSLRIETFDTGLGTMPPGLSTWWNGTGRPEPVNRGDVIDYDRLARVLADVLGDMHVRIDGQKVGDVVVEPRVQAAFAHVVRAREGGRRR